MQGTEIDNCKLKSTRTCFNLQLSIINWKCFAFTRRWRSFPSSAPADRIDAPSGPNRGRLANAASRSW